MLTSDYITGLTDGEGSFCVFVRQLKKETWNDRIECHFYIKMREDELPLLKEVKKFLDVVGYLFKKNIEKIKETIIDTRCPI